MVQKVSSPSRAHASLIKTNESSIAFYQLMFGITLTLLLFITILLVFVTKIKDPFISPPVVVITLFIPAWIAFGFSIKGYMNACYNYSEKNCGVQIEHKSA